MDASSNNLYCEAHFFYCHFLGKGRIDHLNIKPMHVPANTLLKQTGLFWLEGPCLNWAIISLCHPVNRSYQEIYKRSMINIHHDQSTQKKAHNPIWKCVHTHTLAILSFLSILLLSWPWISLCMFPIIPSDLHTHVHRSKWNHSFAARTVNKRAAERYRADMMRNGCWYLCLSYVESDEWITATDSMLCHCLN